jgi:membrane-associated phospholipid phosphatase
VTATGNHYFLDSVAGAMVALFAVALLTSLHAGARLIRPLARGVIHSADSRRPRDGASRPSPQALCW